MVLELKLADSQLHEEQIRFDDDGSQGPDLNGVERGYGLKTHLN